MNQRTVRAGSAFGWRLTLTCVRARATAVCRLPDDSCKMLRSVALALVAAASTEAFMAPAAWSSAPVSNRAVAKSGLSSLQMKVRPSGSPACGEACQPQFCGEADAWYGADGRREA